MNLKNEIIDLNVTNIYLDQYKHYVNSAELVSERRLKANTLFISLQSILITLIGLFNVDRDVNLKSLIVLSILGLLISFIWLIYINSFKQLNKLKFTVINEMEANMPFNSYNYEWYLDKSNAEKYIRLSKVEKLIPLFFIACYVILCILKYIEFI